MYCFQIWQQCLQKIFQFLPFVGRIFIKYSKKIEKKICFVLHQFCHSFLPLKEIIDLYHLKFYVSLMFLSMNQAVKVIGIQMEKIRMPSWFLRDQVLILWFFHFLIQPKAPRCHSNFLSLHAHYFHLNYLSSIHLFLCFLVQIKLCK